jgi:signal transduction histidine kinase
MVDPVVGAPAVFHRLSRGNARRRLLRTRLLRTRLPVPPWAATRVQLWILAVAALALLLLTIAMQTLSVTVHTRSGHTMVDSTSGLIGVLAAFVFIERLRSTHEPRDFLMALALGILSATNLFLAAELTPGDANPGHSWRWIIVAARLAGTAILLGAAFYPQVDPDESRRLPRAILAGGVVLAVGSVNLVPSPQGGRLYAQDILKLGAYVLILYGCLIEFRALQRRLVQRVAVDERRRMARDMHDGLAQELAFIATHSQRLGQTGDDAVTVAHLKSAAERALHDSRTTIAVLTSPDDAPLDRLIARTVEVFRSRFAVEVDLDLEHDVLVDAERRNALLRILHEALTNAIRHGSAQRVLVRLTNGRDGPCLRIADDGSGFDVAAAVSAGKGLGLMSMGERAEMLGGGLNIVSSPGTGTVVEVGLP